VRRFYKSILSEGRFSKIGDYLFVAIVFFGVIYELHGCINGKPINDNSVKSEQTIERPETGELNF